MSVRAWYFDQLDGELTRRAKQLTEPELRCYKILCKEIIDRAMLGEPGAPVDEARVGVRRAASSDPTS